ncbi:MAG TPA: hypothetical protein VLI05_02350 [Candidatus Saccharimonadia bacterium]|nr:hypothetical protein [Candidatus Saccharimonadia bacterium]
MLAKTALFIHRSVGRNLLHDGRVRELLKAAKAPLILDDYDQNIDVLTTESGRTKLGLNFPGGDTRPQDYAAIFSAQRAESSAPILELALSYDRIVIKSCYPNSHITSDEQLEAVKGHYQSIARFFADHATKQLIIVTSPPLVPLKTNPAAARRARILATWLADSKLGQNVSVFNLFDQLAAPESEPGANLLRRPYRRWLPLDSHPNARASREVAPRFVKRLG